MAVLLLDREWEANTYRLTGASQSTWTLALLPSGGGVHLLANRLTPQYRVKCYRRHVKRWDEEKLNETHKQATNSLKQRIARFADVQLV